VAARLDFQDLIAKNRRGTWLLLFAAFVLLGVVGATVSWALGGGWPGAIVGVGVAFALTVFAYLSSDKLALRATRAQPAPIEQYPQLHNIIESVSIAAGIPKPSVYIVDDPAPNAFATGRDPQHAAVAVTTGLLQKMNRDELEGVIAHELSHVRNYDIRVMTVAVATAGSIAVITDIFWRIMFWGAIGGRRRDGDRDGGANPLALIALIIVAILAPLAAVLLQAAISRKREALADATAVALTRNPAGLRHALEKLDADSTVVQRTSHATSHLWIESPDEREPGNRGARFNQMFSTHPPLAERINLLRRVEGIGPYEGPEPEIIADLERREHTVQVGMPPPISREHPESTHPAAESMPSLHDLFEPHPGAPPPADDSHLPPPPPPPRR
jgi:heat shock protein HtpX